MFFALAVQVEILAAKLFFANCAQINKRPALLKRGSRVKGKGRGSRVRVTILKDGQDFFVLFVPNKEVFEFFFIIRHNWHANTLTLTFLSQSERKNVSR